MGVPSIDKATENLVKWSARGEWEPLQLDVYAAHFEPVVDNLDLPDDALDVLPDEGADMLSVFILEDFFTTRFGEHGELNVIDDYLKRRGWRESVPARRYLEALRDSIVSLYEVVDIVSRSAHDGARPHPRRRCGEGRGEARLGRGGALGPSGGARRRGEREERALVHGHDPTPTPASKPPPSVPSPSARIRCARSNPS